MGRVYGQKLAELLAQPFVVDLRPGAYTVTFTLQGFSTLKRDRMKSPRAVIRSVISPIITM